MFPIKPEVDQKTNEVARVPVPEQFCRQARKTSFCEEGLDSSVLPPNKNET